jgi:hypothetical protein
MGFLRLTVYDHPSDAVFDPDAVLQKVQQEFPETVVLPGEQLTLAAEQAQAQEAAGHVVETLRRNARSYGPARAFRVPVPEGASVQGRVRRYDVAFLFDEPLPEALRHRLLHLLRSLGVGRLEASGQGRQIEILFDSAAPSADGTAGTGDPQLQQRA